MSGVGVHLLKYLIISREKDASTYFVSRGEAQRNRRSRFRRTFPGRTASISPHLCCLGDGVNAIASRRRRANFTHDHYGHYGHYGHYVWTKRLYNTRVKRSHNAFEYNYTITALTLNYCTVISHPSPVQMVCKLPERIRSASLSFFILLTTVCKQIIDGNRYVYKLT